MNSIGLLNPGQKIVILSAGPVAKPEELELTLWHDIDDPPSDYFMFDICGGPVMANSNWQWRSEFYLEDRYNIFGQAEAA